LAKVNKLFEVNLHRKTPPWGSTLEGDMHPIPEVSTPAVPETQANFILNMIAIVCGLGIVVFVCLATSELDMSPGFF
jgi:hypothetical protein